jgi:hypothetical protein
MRRVVILHEIQNEGLMRAILLYFALYKLWTLLGWRLDIDGLLQVGKKDCSSHRFEEVCTLAMTLKMHIVLALELGCERFIYTAFVNLCNKHEDNAWDAPYYTASTNIPSFYYSRQNVNRLSFQVFPLV